MCFRHDPCSLNKIDKELLHRPSYLRFVPNDWIKGQMCHAGADSKLPSCHAEKSLAITFCVDSHLSVVNLIGMDAARNVSWQTTYSLA
jgi:hypothetical protein